MSLSLTLSSLVGDSLYAMGTHSMGQGEQLSHSHNVIGECLCLSHHNTLQKSFNVTITRTIKILWDLFGGWTLSVFQTHWWNCKRARLQEHGRKMALWEM